MPKKRIRYKVGDKVRIRTDLSSDMKCLSGFNEIMNNYSGETATITYVYDPNVYNIDIDGGEWSWNSEMFENRTEIIDWKKEFEK